MFDEVLNVQYQRSAPILCSHGCEDKPKIVSAFHLSEMHRIHLDSPLFIQPRGHTVGDDPLFWTVIT